MIRDRWVWEKVENGGMLPGNSPELSWSIESVCRDQTLAEWKAVEVAAAEWEPLAKHLGKRFGVEISPPVRGEIGELLRPFEPLPQWHARTKTPTLPTFDEIHIRTLLAQLSAFIESDTLSYVTKTIIVGLRMDEALLPVRLSDQMVIDKMSTEEVQQFGEMDLIQRPLGNPKSLYNWTGYPWLALYWRRSFPKKLMDEFHYDENEAKNLEAEFECVHEALFQSFALLKHGVVGMGGSVTHLAEWDFRSMTVSYPRTDTPRLLSLAVNNMVLSADDVSSLPKLFVTILQRDKDDALAIALRRLMYAMERKRPEDRLIDDMIAAEAVFGQGSKTELSYRISLRMAISSEKLTAAARRETFDLMRNAYEVRSSVVHGGKVKAKHLVVNGGEVPIRSFVASIEDVIRTALRFAVSQEKFSVAALDGMILDGIRS